MRVLVTGAKGQLGHDVVQCLEAAGVGRYSIIIVDFDLSEIDYTVEYIRSHTPDIVIHCAAYTDVDAAEEDYEKCWTINVEVTAAIASICKELNSKMIYISTDYVFSGEEDTPYEINSKPCPLSVYGQTKLQGEREVIRLVDSHFIVRTSWAYGLNGNNFVQSMLHIGKEQSFVSVVADQCGSPTFTEDLAVFIMELVNSEKYGVYHATNEGYCSWAEFAQEIFKESGYPTKVNFIRSDEYRTKAKRPRNSRLSKKSLDDNGFARLPEWKDALKRYLIKSGITFS